MRSDRSTGHSSGVPMELRDEAETLDADIPLLSASMSPCCVDIEVIECIVQLDPEQALNLRGGS